MYIHMAICAAAARRSPQEKERMRQMAREIMEQAHY